MLEHCGGRALDDLEGLDEVGAAAMSAWAASGKVWVTWAKSRHSMRRVPPLFFYLKTIDSQ